MIDPNDFHAYNGAPECTRLSMMKELKNFSSSSLCLALPVALIDPKMIYGLVSV